MYNMNKSEEFDNFGYKSDAKCVLCKSKDTRIESRFGYYVCIDHFNIPPIKIQEIVEKQQNTINYE